MSAEIDIDVLELAPANTKNSVLREVVPVLVTNPIGDKGLFRLASKIARSEIV